MEEEEEDEDVQAETEPKVAVEIDQNEQVESGGDQVDGEDDDLFDNIAL